MTTERVEFTGAMGDTLAARLDTPQGVPRAYALFAHCFTCTKDIFAASRIAQALTDHGIAVLRFDFTGLGSSEGEFANTNFSSNVGDLVAAAEHLRQTRAAPQILIGHSLGGAAVLAAAEQVPEARAVATIGAPFDPAHVAHNFRSSIEEIERTGEAEVLLVGRPFRIKKQFLDDIATQKQVARIAKLNKALVLFHAPLDQTVAIDNARLIYEAAKHPKSFVSLDHADHLLTHRSDAAYVADVLAAIASRYIVDQNRRESPAASPAPGAVVVSETGMGPFQQAIAIGPHRLIGDEPASVGGQGTGPNPYDLLLAALGTCTSMTMRMYANHKGLPLDQVEVVLHHAKIYAEDCADCETDSGKVDEITRDIRLSGDLTDAQRTRLMEIADKCPVHRTLHGEVKVRSHLIED